MLKILVVDDSGISRKMLIRSIPQGIKEISEIIQGKDRVLNAGATGMENKPINVEKMSSIFQKLLV